MTSMFYSFKKIATPLVLLCLIVGSLSASSSVDNPPDPNDTMNPFPDCPPIDRGSILAKLNAINTWFSTVDPAGVLKNAVFPSGLPGNVMAFNAQNPKAIYTTWYNSKQESKVAAGEAARKQEEALRVANEEAARKQAEALREANEKAAKEKEKTERLLEEQRKKTEASQRQLATTTSDLQGQLLAQATAGDLVDRNSRMLHVQLEQQSGLVNFHELTPITDKEKWVLRIPYIKNSDGIRRFINIPFDLEVELDHVMAMTVSDAVTECARRDNDFVYLVNEARLGKLVFDYGGLIKDKGYYAFALPIEYTDDRANKADTIVFSYDNEHDADDAFKKAKFFIDIGLGKAGGSRPTYKIVLTPRPEKQDNEPPALTSLMDSYYHMIERANQIASSYKDMEADMIKLMTDVYRRLENCRNDQEAIAIVEEPDCSQRELHPIC